MRKFLDTTFRLRWVLQYKSGRKVNLDVTSMVVWALKALSQ